MSKVILSGYIEVPARDLDAVREALPAHVALTRDEPGCIVFEVNQHRANPKRFDVYEEFSDEEAFAKHQARTRQSNWASVTRNARRRYEVAYENPKLDDERNIHLLKGKG